MTTKIALPETAKEFVARLMLHLAESGRRMTMEYLRGAIVVQIEERDGTQSRMMSLDAFSLSSYSPDDVEVYLAEVFRDALETPLFDGWDYRERGVPPQLEATILDPNPLLRKEGESSRSLRTFESSHDAS